MNNSDKATPRPWTQSKHVLFGSMIDSETQKSNFELAKLAVNSHDALLEACKAQLEYLKEFNWKPGYKPETMIMLENAIKQAEGGVA